MTEEAGIGDGEGSGTEPGTTPLETWTSPTPSPPIVPTAPAAGIPAPPPPANAPNAAAPSIWAPPSGAASDPPPPPLPPTGGPGAAPPPPGGDPLLAYGSPGPSGHRSKGGLFAVAGLAAVGVLLAGAFAVTSLTASDGAESPEAAVHSFFDAVNDEDAIGALESLAPGERQMLVDPLQDIQTELVRLDVASEFDLEDVPGLDIEITDLEMQTVNLTEDIARVEIVGGTASISTQPADLPAGSVVDDQLANDDTSRSDIEPTVETTDIADEPLDLVAVKRGGSWYVSLAYSLAEAARGDSEGASPLIGQGPAPVGSDSPEAAVRDLADALTQLPDGGDAAIEHLVTLLPPDELAVAYDYLPVWLSGDDSSDDGYFSSDDDGYESSDTFEISDLDLATEGDGSTRRVRVDGFSVHTESTSTYTSYDGVQRSSSSSTDATFDGDCIETTSSYTSSSTSDGPEDETDRFCKGDVADPDGGDTSLGFASLATWSPTLTVVEVDGRWYVSPVRSVLDSTVDALRAMSPEDLQKYLDDLSDGFLGESSEESVSLGGPIDGGTTPTTFLGGDDDATTDPFGEGSTEGTILDLNGQDLGAWQDAYESCAPLVDDVPTDATSEEWDAAYDAYQKCLDAAMTDLLPPSPDAVVPADPGN